MISLRPARRDELETFDEMDRQSHARRFVLQTGLNRHRENFDNPAVFYLSIENESHEFCGYFILVLESETRSVELRRILIDGTKRGIGQAAMAEMERYCKEELGVVRIWLDVFEDNEVGMHIYEKMDYVRFEEQRLEGRKLYLYEKILDH